MYFIRERDGSEFENFSEFKENGIAILNITESQLNLILHLGNAAYSAFIKFNSALRIL